MKLPNIITNNYINRVKTHIPSPTSLSSEYKELWEYIQYYPTVNSLDSNSPSPIQQCPSNMHMVLWFQFKNSPSNTSPSSIKVRIFHSSAAYYFQPKDTYLNINYNF